MSVILEKECIILNLDTQNKEEILQQMSERLHKAGRVTDLDDFLANVKNREELEPTAIGDEIGMPHGKTDSVTTPSICFARLKEPIVWNLETKEEAKIIIMIAVPANESANHLQIISQLARNLMHDDFKKTLANGDEETIYTTINTILVKE